MTSTPPRAVRAAERAYALALRLYPRDFRRAYGPALRQAFRTHCRETWRHGGSGALAWVCMVELGDLLTTALKEHGDELRRARKGTTTMAAFDLPMPATPPRLWPVGLATVIAFVVCLVAGLNLYLLEDANPLTTAAYTASPLLRFSYDAVYLSTLAAGIAVCAAAGHVLTDDEGLVRAGLALLTLMVILGGFGGLLARHPSSFLALACLLSGLVLINVVIGRDVARVLRPRLGQRPAALLGACTGAGVVLVVHLLALMPHTLALNPVSHALYMQARLGETHLNAALVALGLEVLVLAAYAGILVLALRGAFRSPGGSLGHP